MIHLVVEVTQVVPPDEGESDTQSQGTLESDVTRAIEKACWCELIVLRHDMCRGWELARMYRLFQNRGTRLLPFPIQSLMDDPESMLGRMLSCEPVMLTVKGGSGLEIVRRDVMFNLLCLIVPHMPDTIFAELISAWSWSRAIPGAGTGSGDAYTFHRALCEYYFEVSSSATTRGFLDIRVTGEFGRDVCSDTCGEVTDIGASLTGALGEVPIITPPIASFAALLSIPLNLLCTSSFVPEEVCVEEPDMDTYRVILQLIPTYEEANGQGVRMLRAFIDVVDEGPERDCEHDRERGWAQGRADQIIRTLYYMLTSNRQSIRWLGTHSPRPSMRAQPHLDLRPQPCSHCPKAELYSMTSRFGLEAPYMSPFGTGRDAACMPDVCYAQWFLSTATDPEIQAAFIIALESPEVSEVSEPVSGSAVSLVSMFVEVLVRSSGAILKTMGPHCRCAKPWSPAGDMGYGTSHDRSMCGTMDLVACLTPLHALQLLEMLVCGSG